MAISIKSDGGMKGRYARRGINVPNDDTAYVFGGKERIETTEERGDVGFIRKHVHVCKLDPSSKLQAPSSC